MIINDTGQNGLIAPVMTLRVINSSRNGNVVAERVEWAGTSALRRKGLLGRASLDPQEGMYIVPCGWVHTFRMQFPIDLVFLAGDGRVLSVQHGLRPNRLSKLILRAEGVLELAAGQLKATGTVKGDYLQFVKNES